MNSLWKKKKKEKIENILAIYLNHIDYARG